MLSPRRGGGAAGQLGRRQRRGRGLVAGADLVIVAVVVLVAFEAPSQVTECPGELAEAVDDLSYPSGHLLGPRLAVGPALQVRCRKGVDVQARSDGGAGAEGGGVGNGPTAPAELLTPSVGRRVVRSTSVPPSTTAAAVEDPLGGQ